MGAKNKWSDLKRAEIWLREVESRRILLGWSKYRLDMHFWPPEERDGRLSHQRPKRFARIVKGKLPSDGRKRWKKSDLIDRVDGDPLFAGTKAVYAATFWEMWSENPIRIGEALNRIRDFIEVFELRRLDELELLRLIEKRPNVSRTQLYKECVDACCDEIRYFERPGFLWTLHRVTSSPANAGFQQVVAELLDRWFEQFVTDHLPVDEQMIFYDEVMTAIRTDRLNLDADPSALDALENVGREFMLPKSALAA